LIAWPQINKKTPNSLSAGTFYLLTGLGMTGTPDFPIIQAYMQTGENAKVVPPNRSMYYSSNKMAEDTKPQNPIKIKKASA
jgi:hypothetical protein